MLVSGDSELVIGRCALSNAGVAAHRPKLDALSFCLPYSYQITSPHLLALHLPLYSLDYSISSLLILLYTRITQWFPATASRECWVKVSRSYRHHLIGRGS